MFDIYNFGYDKNNINEIISLNPKLLFHLQNNINEVLKNHSNPNLEKFKPKGGYEFVDKSNYNEGIGIYHSHLDRIDGKLWVLIWYFKENSTNYFEIIFEVMIHPTDDYNQVLTDIKNDPLTLNPNTWKNFLEKFKILLTFDDFNNKSININNKNG